MEKTMIRKLSFSDFDSILKVINDSAQAYKGVIPKDRWKDPYMLAEELRKEIKAGVIFGKYTKVIGMAGFYRRDIQYMVSFIIVYQIRIRAGMAIIIIPVLEVTTGR